MEVCSFGGGEDTSEIFIRFHMTPRCYRSLALEALPNVWGRMYLLIQFLLGNKAEKLDVAGL
jgi:hypothetical protein